ncbi:MAG: phosphodiester glycosidase family protein, partial [Tepidisphaeraceae bacterium]
RRNYSRFVNLRESSMREKNLYRIVIVASLLCFSAITRAESFPATRPYKPVVYQYVEQTDPPQRIHVIAIDLANPDVRVRVSRGGPDPDGEGKWTTTLQRPTAIAEREGFEVTINGDFFSHLSGRDAEGAAALKAFRGNTPATVSGPATTDGDTWAVPNEADGRPSFLIDAQNRPAIAKIAKPPEDARQVIAGSDIIVEGGKNVARTGKGFPDTRHPRTAVGIADGGKRLLLVVVDGRNKEKAVGMSLTELSKVMLELKCESALNLDGGGSSAIVLRDPKTGEQEILNRPSDGRERSVANVLGVDVGEVKKRVAR